MHMHSALQTPQWPFSDQTLSSSSSSLSQLCGTDGGGESRTRLLGSEFVSDDPDCKVPAPGDEEEHVDDGCGGERLLRRFLLLIDLLKSASQSTLAFATASATAMAARRAALGAEAELAWAPLQRKKEQKHMRSVASP